MKMFGLQFSFFTLTFNLKNYLNEEEKKIRQNHPMGKQFFTFSLKQVGYGLRFICFLRQ
jgi:hypothetical protein